MSNFISRIWLGSIQKATELTTQATAEYPGCSRWHVIKLLEAGEEAGL